MSSGNSVESGRASDHVSKQGDERELEHAHIRPLKVVERQAILVAVKQLGVHGAAAALAGSEGLPRLTLARPSGRMTNHAHPSLDAIGNSVFLCCSVFRTEDQKRFNALKMHLLVRFSEQESPGASFHWIAYYFSCRRAARWARANTRKKPFSSISGYSPQIELWNPSARCESGCS